MKHLTLQEVVEEGFIAELSRLGLTVMIYGSYAYGTDTLLSDLDVLAVGEHCSDGLLAQVVSVIRGGQTRLGTPIDDEVPPEVKLLASWDDLAQAATGSHFYESSEHKAPTICPIRKTAEFLSSGQMRMRLFQNIVIGHVVSFTDHPERLRDLQLQARKAMVQTYARLHNCVPSSSAEIVDWLVGSGDSDLWLGFRDNCAVRSHLHAAVGEALRSS